ncbi:MAG: hypothetical protein DCC67_00350 [Planctomycetota bacterium]|nr:MAG: hypothetical protein DCC67_00350 [Planctomycetota bacterium]
MAHYVYGYLVTSRDGTNWIGVTTTALTSSAQGTYTANDSRNLPQACELRPYSLDPANGVRGRAVVRLTARYVAPDVHDYTGRRLKNFGAHTMTLQAIPAEGQ